METEEAFHRFGTDDTHENGYRPLKQLLKWPFAWSLETTPWEKGTSAYSPRGDRLCKWMSVPAVDPVNARGASYRPLSLNYGHFMNLNKRPPVSVRTTQVQTPRTQAAAERASCRVGVLLPRTNVKAPRAQAGTGIAMRCASAGR